ncbi:MAG: hypothetical protein HYX94_04420 [Chloroflexi bacterium]|nr:hypothetical protein [Chloroflexota bacterium]
MKKNSGVVLLFFSTIISLSLNGPVGESAEKQDWTPLATSTATASLVSRLYLPIVLKAEPTATPTAVPTATPTATSTPTPATNLLPVGQTVNFKGWRRGIRLQGTVNSSERTSVLTDSWGTVWRANGIFLVGLMNLYNSGLESDDASLYSSFRVVDSVGRHFDLALLEIQLAAQYRYSRIGVYDTIQPGFTLPAVFVFDVLPESDSLQLESLSPW